MPTYEYKCENGHTFEIEQRITAEPLIKCKICHAPCNRVISSVGIMFKGSGFHVNDYGRGKVSKESKPSTKPAKPSKN